MKTNNPHIFLQSFLFFSAFYFFHWCSESTWEQTVEFDTGKGDRREAKQEVVLQSWLLFEEMEEVGKQPNRQRSRVADPNKLDFAGFFATKHKGFVGSYGLPNNGFEWNTFSYQNSNVEIDIPPPQI